MKHTKRIKKEYKIVWMFFIMLLCLVLLIGFFLQTSHRQAVETAKVATHNLVEIIEARVSSDFMNIEALLTFVARELGPRILKLSTSTSEQVAQSQQLTNLIASFPSGTVINVFDVEGILRHSSNPDADRISIADRRHFQYLRDNPNVVLEFSEVQVARTTGKMSLVMVHAIRDETGQFLGVTSAVIHMDAFAEMFESINIGSGGNTLLRRSDNFALIMQIPRLNETDINQVLPNNNQIRMRVEAGEESGTLTYTSLDGIEGIASFKMLKQWPFYVQVFMTKNHYLARWRQEAIESCVLLAILVLVLGFAICRLRRATDKLYKSEEKHRLLTEHTDSAIAIHEIVLDDAGKPVNYIFRSANPAFESHTGLRVSDILNHRVTEVLPGIENAPFIEVYGKVVLTGESVSFEQYSELENRYYFINAYRLDESHFATLFSDITERKQIEEDLLLAKEKAEEANLIKSQFLANMSHEIRTPMNGIFGFLELLQTTNPTSEQKDFIREAKSSSMVLLTIINDILDFSKIEAGKLNMVNINFNIRTTVEDAIFSIVPKASEKNIEVHTMIKASGPKNWLATQRG